MPPSCDADSADKDDWKEPIGVLVAETITTSLNRLELKNLMFLLKVCESLKENAILHDRRLQTFASDQVTLLSKIKNTLLSLFTQFKVIYLTFRFLITCPRSCRPPC